MHAVVLCITCTEVPLSMKLTGLSVVYVGQEPREAALAREPDKILDAKVQVMVAHHRRRDADFVQYGHHVFAFGDRGHHGGVEAVPAEQDQRVPVGMCFHLPCSEVRASAVGPLEATQKYVH
jgi:hypothetical protein